MTDTIAQKIAVRGLHVVVGVLVAATPWAVSCSGQTPLPPDPPSLNPGGGGPVEGPGPQPQAGRRLRIERGSSSFASVHSHLRLSLFP